MYLKENIYLKERKKKIYISKKERIFLKNPVLKNTIQNNLIIIFKTRHGNIIKRVV